MLRSLNLPASLDALERPIGLPPSLLKKAEEIRLEEGPSRIEESIENVEKLAEYNTKLLDEVCTFAIQREYLSEFPSGHGHS
jgi:programmed cell death 6-interacting protein